MILDFDGTIADTRSGIVSTVNETLGMMGLPAADETEVISRIGLPLAATFEGVIENADARLIGEAVKLYRSIYNNVGLRMAVLYPYVGQTLRYLHGRGVTVAVASSKGRGALEMLLADSGIIGSIDMVMGDEDVGNKKPAPDMVLRILEKSGIPAEDAIVAGDTVYDIRMGRAAGCVTCAVSYGYGMKTRSEQNEADYVIDRFDEIIGFFQ